MENIFSRGLLEPAKSFWRAVIRFGSPRFSIESAVELMAISDAKNDEFDDDLDCRCQLEAA